MNKNKHYGFDEDVEIDYMDIFIDACDKRKAVEEEARQEEAHDDAVDLIVDKINNFFRYFEERGVMYYVDEAAAAKQIILSLTESGHVPPSLLLDAAYKLENNIYCNDGVPMRTPPKVDSIKRKHIVTKLVRYLENGRPNPQINPQTLEFEYPLPNVPTFVESNN